MLRKVTMLLAVCTLSLSASSAADTFAGTWKFNQVKSDLPGRVLTIESQGGNQYKFTAGDEAACAAEDNTNSFAFSVTADGTDQPTRRGATWAITTKDASTWEVAYKTNGTTMEAVTWSLSADGSSLLVNSKSASGSESNETLRRVSGTAGFVGAWQKIDPTKTYSLLQITTSADGSLAINWPSDNVAMATALDGKDFAVVGPTVLQGSTAAATLIDAHLIRMTDKIDGKRMDTVDWQLSSDGNTLTLTEHDAGTKKAIVSVYDRQ